MTEFEIHQLIIGSRWEFDRASIMVFVLCTVVGLISVCAKNGLNSMVRGALTLMTLIGTGYFFIRGFAAIRRFILQNELLKDIDAQFVHSFPAVQLPTVLLRVAFLVSCVVVALVLINANKAKED